MRMWSAKEKAEIVLEVLSGQRTVAEACRAYGVAESLFYRWQREFLESAYAAVMQSSKLLWRRSLAGQRGLDVEVLKEASGLCRQRKGGCW